MSSRSRRSSPRRPISRCSVRTRASFLNIGRETRVHYLLREPRLPLTHLRRSGIGAETPVSCVLHFATTSSHHLIDRLHMPRSRRVNHVVDPSWTRFGRQIDCE
jgi:hypothetical protein